MKDKINIINIKSLKVLLIFIPLSFLVLFTFSTKDIFAQTADDIKAKINQRNNEIEALEKEIASYQNEINVLGKESNTLKNTIAELDVSKKKLEAELKLTERRITGVNTELASLNSEIGDKSERIEQSKRVVSHSMRAIQQSDTSSILDAFIGTDSLSDAWQAIDGLVYLQEEMRTHVKDLSEIKADLEVNKKKQEIKKAELLSLTRDLRAQASLISETTKEKSALLSQTKNLEVNYANLLKNKMAQKEAFEREIIEFESALQIAIDQGSLPASGSGAIRWPLDNIFITQYFGNTAFATQNPSIYNGKGHTGIDLRASIGTPVRSAQTGIVVGTGNTDAVRGCFSYGKWIMVKHPNGLSTLYAHLSIINVKEGDTVVSGEVIGYSGNTGYSTGPHLHFGVYATQGVRITQLTSSRNCTGVVIPLADLKAYLNPLSYLK